MEKSDERYLEMWTCDRLRKLVEQWLLYFSKFSWIHDLKDVFHFVEKHNLFRAIYFGPVSQKP